MREKSYFSKINVPLSAYFPLYFIFLVWCQKPFSCTYNLLEKKLVFIVFLTNVLVPRVSRRKIVKTILSLSHIRIYWKVVYILRGLTAVNHVTSFYSISNKLLEEFCSHNWSEAVQGFLIEAKYLFYNTEVNMEGCFALFKSALNSRLLLLDYGVIGKRQDVS